MTAARKTAFTGILAAVAVCLSFLEGLLPALPFLPPGAKLGLSNIAVMYAACYCSLPAALSVAAIKSVFVLLTRGGMAFFMSFAGGMLSCVVLWIFLSAGRFGCIGAGIAGAAAHNSAQLLVFFLFAGKAALWYAPVLLLFSLPAGALTGFLLRVTDPFLRRLALHFPAGKINNKHLFERKDDR